MITIAERRQRFRALHESGCFAIPNPWDIGSARYLQHLGFKAIATTSAGFAFSRGLSDGAVPRDEMLAHIKELVDATDLPVNADSKMAMPMIRTMSPKASGSASPRAWRVFRLRRHMIRKEVPFMSSILPSSESRQLKAIGDSGVVLVGRAEGFLVGREYVSTPGHSPTGRLFGRGRGLLLCAT